MNEKFRNFILALGKEIIVTTVISNNRDGNRVNKIYYLLDDLLNLNHLNVVAYEYIDKSFRYKINNKCYSEEEMLKIINLLAFI